MYRGAFATHHSLTCVFYLLIQEQISINFSRTNFRDDKSRMSLSRELNFYIQRKCAPTLCGILNAMSTWNGAAHFSGEVSRWTYPSGKTIVASPETDGFRLYLEDQADEPRLWSYKVSCENLLSSACSSPRICWIEIWNVSSNDFIRVDGFVILIFTSFFFHYLNGLNDLKMALKSISEI